MNILEFTDTLKQISVLDEQIKANEVIIDRLDTIIDESNLSEEQVEAFCTARNERYNQTLKDRRTKWELEGKVLSFEEKSFARP